MYDNMDLSLNTNDATHNLSCLSGGDPKANCSGFMSQNVNDLIGSMLKQSLDQIQKIVQQAQAAEQQAQAQAQAGMQQIQDQPKPSDSSSDSSDDDWTPPVTVYG
jgi:hypothetical protein